MRFSTESSRQSSVSACARAGGSGGGASQAAEEAKRSRSGFRRSVLHKQRVKDAVCSVGQVAALQAVVDWYRRLVLTFFQVCGLNGRVPLHDGAAARRCTDTSRAQKCHSLSLSLLGTERESSRGAEDSRTSSAAEEGLRVTRG